VLVQQAEGPANDTYYLAEGYSSVLQSHTDSRLLYNALHAARVEYEMPENVVSLTQHYEQQLGGVASSLHILVAEDNETNQQVLRGILEGVGHTVSITSDGLAAIDAIEMTDPGFDLMIFDLNMPQMGGLEAMKMARFMEIDRHVPTIILTADATAEALRRCEEAGADAYLTKPVESRRLLETIAGLCRDMSAGGANKHAVEEGSGHLVVPASSDILIDENVLQGLLRLGSGIEFFEELVASFGRDVKNLIKMMRRAVSELDYPVLQDSAHAMRGSASEFGACRLVHLCIRIRELKPYDMTSAKPAGLLEEVEQTFDSSRLLLDEFARRRREASR
jgi:two-component system sensor histidine kinase RpfC